MFVYVGWIFRASTFLSEEEKEEQHKNYFDFLDFKKHSYGTTFFLGLALHIFKDNFFINIVNKCK